MKKAVCPQPPKSPSSTSPCQPHTFSDVTRHVSIEWFFVDAGKGVEFHLQSDKGGKENTACILLEPDEE